MNLSGPGSITAIANLIVILGVLLAPFTILSFMFRLRGEMKRDAGERFEAAAQLQNSINSLMVAFVTALMRDGVSRGIPVQGQGQQDGAGSKYENWSPYNDGFQLTAQQVPLLLENSTPVKKRRRSGNSVLIGVLSGVSIFLLLALITVLTVKI